MTGSFEPPGTPPAPQAGSGGAPAGSNDFFDRLRGIGVVRPRAGRMAGGVCVGLANRLGVAPLVVRVALVLLMSVGGLGLLTYLVALALIPDERGKVLLEGALRRGEGDGIVLLVVIGVLLAAEVSDRAWVWLGIPLAILTWWIVRGVAAGKTPRELRDEASQFGRGLAGTARELRRPDPAGTSAASSPPHRAHPPANTPADPSAAYPPGYPRPAAAAPPRPTHGTHPGTHTGTQTAAGGGHPAYPQSARGLGPGRTFSPTQPTVLAPPPRRRPRAGFAFFATVVGLGAALVGGLLNTALLQDITQRPLAVALAAAAGLAGLALLVAGVRGLRAGGTAFVATAALAAALVVGFTPSNVPITGGVGERTWLPAAGQADPAYQLAMGEGTLDLGALPRTGAGQVVSASIGLGSLVVIVPADRTVQVDVGLGAGDLTVRDLNGTSRSKSSGVAGVTAQTLLVGDPSRPPDAVVHASVGLGEIVIKTPSPVTGGLAGNPAQTAPTSSGPSTRNQSGGAR